MYAAIDAAIDTYMLNVGAAGYYEIMHGSLWGEIVFEILDAIEDQTNLDLATWMDLIVQLEFIVAEGADPAAFAPHVTARPLEGMEGRNVQFLHQMAAFDETLGGPAGGFLSRLLGLTQIQPIVWTIADSPSAAAPFTGSGVYQYDTSDHSVWYHTPECQEQGGYFLQTWYQTGTGVIIDPFAQTVR